MKRLFCTLQRGVMTTTNSTRSLLKMKGLALGILTIMVGALVSAFVFAHMSRVFADDSTLPPQRAVRSGAEIRYPPFSFVDAHGRAAGFAVELLRATLSAMGKEVTFNTGPWSQVREWLEKGELDALPLVGRRPERKPFFDFTVPYMTLHGAIVVRNNETRVKHLKDLRGLRVAVMKGDNAEEFLRQKDRGITIITTPSFDIALKELSRGNCDGVIMQRLVALRLIERTGLTDLKIVDYNVEGFQQDFCFAVTKGNSKMLAILNEGLAIVMANGTYRHLHSKWFATMELPSGRPIIVGGDRNYPPYEFLDKNGEPAGYNVDLTRAIARKMNLNVEIRLGTWSERLAALKNGQIDLVQGIYYSPQRNKDFDFSQHHLVSNYVTVVRKEAGIPPQSLDELSGKTIIVEEGDILEDFAKNHGLSQHIVAVSDQEEALRQLAQGTHDCAIVSLISAIHLIDKNKWTNLVYGMKPMVSAEYCYGTRKGQVALLSTFSDGLRELDRDGEYRKIHDKWLGIYKEQPSSLVDALRYSAIVIGPLILFLLIAFIWSWSLRKQVTEKTKALEDSLDKFRYFFDAANVGKSITLPTGEVFPNKAFADFLGYTIDEMKNRTWQTLTPDEDVEASKKIVGSLLTGDKGSERFEKRFIHKDGRFLWADMSVALRRDSNGNPMYFMTTVVDITKRKEALFRVEHLNKLLRAISDVNQLILREEDKHNLIHEGCRLLVSNRGYKSALIVLTDAGNNPVLWAMDGLAGSSNDLRSQLEKGILPPCCSFMADKREILVIEDKNLTCSECTIGEACARNQSLCATLIHNNKVFGYLAAAGEKQQIIDNEEKELFTEMAVNIAYALSVIELDEARQKEQTRSEKLQSQLVQSQKMESVGRLAGGVAHDFNNMLGVIIGYAELASEKVTPDDPLHDDLHEILIAARRSADITRQLLAFARKQTIVPETLDLNKAVKSILKMLRRLIGENIHLSWNPGKNLRPVKMDPSQLNQILTNLCLNAQDAISNVGEIIIETDFLSFDNQYCEEHSGFEPGQYVLLAIKDNGTGMDNTTLKNVFEPFFTTKEVGKGTGLGLATVYGIVKQNKGFVHVDSLEGSGTTFSIYFPCAGESAESGTPSAVVKTPQAKGKTLLIVEDEPSILKMVQKILEGLEYTVLLASTPEEALSQAKECREPIDLVISDVMMPEMNGSDLSRSITQVHPEAKVLLMSGYTADVISEKELSGNGVHFIQKPFSNTDLANKVQSIIHSQADKTQPKQYFP